MRPRRSNAKSEPPAVSFANAESDAGGYSTLRERAVDFVIAKGGTAKDEELVAFVFGGIGAAAVWQALLARILGDEPRLIHQPDGRWMLRDSGRLPGASLLSEFVAIDVETTGLQARTQRVIDVALIRYRDGAEVERIDTLVNPQRRIPKYIAQLTQIDNDRVDDAPLFGDIAQEVEEFLDGALLLGHNVAFDINFLNAELARAGRRTLINERLDTMSLAVRLVPELRRPSLDKIATALGLTPRKIHRAGIDAELTARVAYLLMERAKSMGVDSLDRIKSIAARPATAPKEGVGRGRAVLDKSLLAAIPKAPGVYIMRDQFDRIIYVGKAKNLRDRVGSYYSQPLGYTRKMDGLLESLVAIDTEETGSELGALLLESQLIRRWQPRYNVMMRSFERYPFIRVDLANPWPRITLAKARKDDGARYFGPYRSPKAAKIAVELVNEHFPLRTCRRSFKDARSYGAPCIRLDMGQCLGPCVGRADRDNYMDHVRSATTFLEGDDDQLLERLWTCLEQAAADLDYERARRLRNDVQTLQSIVGAQRALRESIERNTLLIVQPAPGPDCIEVMLLVRGQRWASFYHQRNADPADLRTRLETAWQRAVENGGARVEHDSLDEVHILNRWIASHDGHPAILRFDAELPDWASLVTIAVAMTNEQLTAALVEEPEESAEDDLADDEDDVDEAVPGADQPSRPVFDLESGFDALAPV